MNQEQIQQNSNFNYFYPNYYYNYQNQIYPYFYHTQNYNNNYTTPVYNYQPTLNNSTNSNENTSFVNSSSDSIGSPQTNFTYQQVVSNPSERTENKTPELKSQNSDDSGVDGSVQRETRSKRRTRTQFSNEQVCIFFVY